LFVAQRQLHPVTVELPKDDMLSTHGHGLSNAQGTLSAALSRVNAVRAIESVATQMLTVSDNAMLLVNDLDSEQSLVSKRARAPVPQRAAASAVVVPEALSANVTAAVSSVSVDISLIGMRAFQFAASLIMSYVSRSCAQTRVTLQSRSRDRAP